MQRLRIKKNCMCKCTNEMINCLTGVQTSFCINEISNCWTCYSDKLQKQSTSNLTSANINHKQSVALSLSLSLDNGGGINKQTRGPGMWPAVYTQPCLAYLLHMVRAVLKEMMAPRHAELTRHGRKWPLYPDVCVCVCVGSRKDSWYISIAYPTLSDATLL